MAARSLLALPPLPRVQSLHTHTAPSGTTALTDDEKAQLAQLPLPARIRVVPDLPPAEGRPRTLVRLNSQDLPRDVEGVSMAAVVPGQYQLEVLHAGARTRVCVLLTPCETVQLTAHGSELAPHQAVSKGPC